MHRSHVFWGSGDSLLEALQQYTRQFLKFVLYKARGRTDQLIKYTLIQIHLRFPAFEHVVVVVFEALPVGIELLQAVSVDILDPVECQFPYSPKLKSFVWYIRYIHTSRTAGDFATLLETVQLSSAIGIGLALHVVIVIGTAAVSDKKRCAHKGSGCGADFLDFGDVIWHWRRIDEDVLTESVGRVQLAFRMFL